MLGPHGILRGPSSAVRSSFEFLHKETVPLKRVSILCELVFRNRFFFPLIRNQEFQFLTQQPDKTAHHYAAFEKEENIS